MRRGMLLGDDGDLMVENGGLAIGQTDDQNVSMLISASKGEFKHAPALGVGMVDFIKKSSPSASEELKRRISVNLKADGYKVNRLNLSPAGELNLDYE